MSTVFLKSTRALNTIEQVTAHAKYVGFRSKELNEKGFFDKNLNNSDYKLFIKKVGSHPALKFSKSIKAHKLIFSLRERDYAAYKRSGKDYKDLIRATLNDYEKNHGVKLEWIANVHEKDDHPHCHVIIMGASSEKDSSGRYKRIFFSKDDYAQIKQDFDLHLDKDAEYYDTEKIDLEKTIKSIELGFDRINSNKEIPFRGNYKFEYGKFNDNVNLFKLQKIIRSTVIPTDSKYYSKLSGDDIAIVKNNTAAVGLKDVSILNIDKAIKGKIKEINELTSKADINKAKDDVRKLEEIKTILKQSFKKSVLKTYTSDEFKHMSNDAYTKLNALNEYYGTTLTSDQLRDRYADVSNKYNDLISKLRDVTDNKERLNNATDIIREVEKGIKKLSIIDLHKDDYGDKYRSIRSNIEANIEHNKDILNEIGVKDKEDLKEQIIQHNGNARYVHDIKENLSGLYPEYDTLKKTVESMDKSIEIEDRLSDKGFIDIGKGLEQVLKKIAKDAEREQSKAEFVRYREEEKQARKNNKDRDR